MNTDLFLAYIAAGSISELITIRNTTHGGRLGIVIMVLLGGLVLGAYVPESLTDITIFVILVARGGSVLGRVLGTGIDIARVKKWQLQNQRVERYPNLPKRQ